jgi:hypothetical protein
MKNFQRSRHYAAGDIIDDLVAQLGLTGMNVDLTSADSIRVTLPDLAEYKQVGIELQIAAIPGSTTIDVSYSNTKGFADVESTVNLSAEAGMTKVMIEVDSFNYRFIHLDFKGFNSGGTGVLHQCYVVAKQ